MLPKVEVIYKKKIIINKKQVKINSTIFLTCLKCFHKLETREHQRTHLVYLSVITIFTFGANIFRYVRFIKTTFEI